MNIEEQLLLALPFDPLDKAIRDIETLKIRYESNRRSLHAKNGELQKKYDELRNEFDVFKRALCTSDSDYLDFNIKEF